MGGGELTVQARHLGDLVDVACGCLEWRHCRRGRRRCCRRGILVILWMSLRVGIVPCVSKIDTLGLFLSLLKADEKLRVSLVNGPN